MQALDPVLPEQVTNQPVSYFMRQPALGMGIVFKLGLWQQ